MKSRRARRYGSATPEWMVELLKEYCRTQDRVIRNQIVLENMDLVEQVAHRFRYSSEPMEDLVQEGVIGLIHAVEMFDLERGVQFATYATHAISGAIQHYLRDRSKLIREPGWLHDLNQKINKARLQMTPQLGRDPSVAELANRLNLSPETVDYVIRTRDLFQVSSLEQPPAEEGEDYWTAEANHHLSTEPLSPSLSIEDRLVLEAAVKRLRRVEQKIIRDFFFEDRTQTEIAEQLGYSRSHVSHLMSRALKRLRHFLAADGLTEQTFSWFCS